MTDSPVGPGGPTVPVGVVLCGGRSTRMGTDKAAIGSPPWAHRVAAALTAGGCEPTQLVGGDPALADPRWPHVPDEHPGAGPGAALLAVCRAHRGSALVVSACDLPNLTEAAVRALVVHVDQGAPVAVHDVGERPQWSLVAISAPRVEELAGIAGERSPSLGRLLAPGAVHVQPSDPVAVTDIDEPARGSG